MPGLSFYPLIIPLMQVRNYITPIGPTPCVGWRLSQRHQHIMSDWFQNLSWNLCNLVSGLQLALNREMQFRLTRSSNLLREAMELQERMGEDPHWSPLQKHWTKETETHLVCAMPCSIASPCILFTRCVIGENCTNILSVNCVGNGINFFTEPFTFLQTGEWNTALQPREMYSDSAW